MRAAHSTQNTDTMNIPLPNNTTLAHSLKLRKAHLNELLEVIELKQEKPTNLQTLTVNAINSEIKLIDHKLINRS